MNLQTLAGISARLIPGMLSNWLIPLTSALMLVSGSVSAQVQRLDPSQFMLPDEYYGQVVRLLEAGSVDKARMSALKIKKQLDKLEGVHRQTIAHGEKLLSTTLNLRLANTRNAEVSAICVLLTGLLKTQQGAEHLGTFRETVFGYCRDLLMQRDNGKPVLVDPLPATLAFLYIDEASERLVIANNSSLEVTSVPVIRVLPPAPDIVVVKGSSLDMDIPDKLASLLGQDRIQSVQYQWEPCSTRCASTIALHYPGQNRPQSMLLSQFLQTQPEVAKYELVATR